MEVAIHTRDEGNGDPSEDCRLATLPLFLGHSAEGRLPFPPVWGNGVRTCAPRGVSERPNTVRLTGALLTAV